MDPLELSYASAEEIPAGYEALYTEKDGKWNLTNVKFAPAPNVSVLQKSLDAERAAHKKTKADKATLATELETVKVSNEELVLAAESTGKKPDDAKIAELVEKRVKIALTPVQTKLQAAESLNTQLQAQLSDASTREKQVTIRAALAKVAAESKMLTNAVDGFVRLSVSDFEVNESGAVVARENSQFAVGGDPSAYLNEFKPKNTHFWPQNQGGGATGATGGGGGKNPFSKESWNETEQLKLDAPTATRLAAAVGVDPNRPVRPK